MKNRKIVIVAFLLIASFCLSIGYAVSLQDDLDVNGNVSYDMDEVQDTFDANVRFTNPVAENGVTCTLEDEDDTLVISMDNTVFTQKGDSTVIKVDIENESLEMDAAVTVDAPVVVPELRTFFTVEVTNAPATVAAGGTATYEITVTMVEWPSDVNGDLELTNADLFSIALEASYAN